MPSFQGITIWGVLAFIVYGTWKVAEKFFSKSSSGIKLLIFFTLIVVYIGIGGVIFYSIKNGELTNSPVPPAPPTPVAYHWSLIPEAYAKDRESWIYCGDYDSSKKQWLTTNIDANTPGPSPGEKTFSVSELTHREVTAKTDLDVYDGPPTFSPFGLKWTFGSVISSIHRGEKTVVLDTVSVGKERIWCKISPKPG
jgi:hypothetical protein